MEKYGEKVSNSSQKISSVMFGLQFYCSQLLKTTIFILCSSNSKEQGYRCNCKKENKKSGENNKRLTIKTKKGGGGYTNNRGRGEDHMETALQMLW